MGLVSLGVGMASVGCSDTTTGGAAGGGPARAHAVLAHVPHGEADLSYDPETRSLLVGTSVTGLAADSIHPTHIHSGSCEHPGRVAYALSPVSADSNGLAADRTSTAPHVSEGRIPASGWYIDMHNGPDVTPDAQAQVIACGNVANPSGATQVTVPLVGGSPDLPDQTASGAADVSSRDGQSTVTVTVHGLVPQSRHAVDLHAGTCEAQAVQLAALTPLAADQRGDASATSPLGVSVPAGPLYVMVHRTTAADNQTDFDPILCGNLSGA